MAQNKEDRREAARGILAQFRVSGLSQREFAQQEGVSASTLAYWLRRERVEHQLKGETTLVAEIPRGASSCFTVEFGEIRIEVPRDASLEEWRLLRKAWGS